MSSTASKAAPVASPSGPRQVEIPRRFPAVVADWLLYCMRQVTTGQIFVVLQLRGRVDEVRLNRALRLAMDAEPLLGCRFVDGWYRPHWRRCDDLDQQLHCRVIETDNPQAALETYLTASFDPRERPQAEAAVIRGQTDTVCLQLNHMVGDGGALKQFTYLVCDLYRRLKTEPHYVPAPNLRGSRSMMVLGRQFSLRQKWQILGEMHRNISAMLKAKGRWDIPLPAGGSGLGRIAQRYIPAEQVRAMYSFGRRQRATANLVLLAAIYRAMYGVAARGASDPLPIRITVDVRQHLESREPEPLCNRLGSAGLVVDPARAATMEDVVAQLRDQMKAQKQSYFGLGSVPLVLETFPIVSWLVRLLPYAWIKRLFGRRVRTLRSKPLGALVITSPGELDSERTNLGDVEIEHASIRGQTVLVPGAVALIVSGFRGGMWVTAAHLDTQVQPELVEAVLDRMMLELPGHEKTAGASD